ncbi:MAG: glycosyltransferase family 4 protein [Nitrospirae bacterium]|nr:glycosyltransferase family 4 protein [Nitrospirota bacterium]
MKNGLSVAMVVASPFPANHGTPGSIKEMVDALMKLGHNIHLVTYHQGEKDINIDGVNIHRIPFPGFSRNIKVGPTFDKPFLDILLAHKLLQVVRSENIDLVHAHNYEGLLSAVVARPFIKKPVIYHAINTMSDELPSYNFIRPKVLAVALARMLDKSVPVRADHLIAISSELKDFLVNEGVRKEKISRIPLGVNGGIFLRGNRQQIRDMYGIGSRPLVLYTGLLNSFQRLDYLVIAMKRVVSQIPDALLMIVPNLLNGKELQVLNDLIDRNGLGKNVIITDRVSFTEIPDYLAAADVTALPRPNTPGFPVKLLNYMAAGKAIVCFTGSAKGLINRESAIVVDDHDSNAFGEGITILLKDNELREYVARGARALFFREFDWKNVAKKIDGLYNYVLTKKVPVDLKDAISYYDRRDNGHNGESNITQNRNGDRRKYLKNIDFPERRRIILFD